MKTLELALLGRRVERPARLVASVPVCEAEEVLQGRRRRRSGRPRGRRTGRRPTARGAPRGPCPAPPARSARGGARPGRRASSCTRACSRIRPRAAGLTPSIAGATGRASPPRAASVGISRATSRCRWAEVMPATSERWSVGAPPGGAVAVPVAKPAMLDRFRIGLRRGRPRAPRSGGGRRGSRRSYSTTRKLASMRPSLPPSARCVRSGSHPCTAASRSE